MVRYGSPWLVASLIGLAVNAEKTVLGAIKNTKQRANFIFGPPRNYVVTSAYDPVEPFQQIYGLNCGKNDFDRIVGGGLTTLESHPWQVYVQIGGMYMCGGAIISDKWIATAAHCVNGYQSGHIVVIHGLTVLPQSQVKAENWAYASSLHVHADYNRFNNMYDIALIELTNKLDFSDGNRWPACLPPNDFCVAAGEDVTVSGWGATAESGNTSPTLKAVNVPQLSAADCYNRMLAIGRQISKPTMTCAGGEIGEDACQGDSGGPLTYRDANGVHTLVGLVSWGVGCARQNIPGIYTRVTYMLQWIKAISQVDNDGGDSAMFCGDDVSNAGSTAAPTTTTTTALITTTASTTTVATTTASTPLVIDSGFVLNSKIVITGSRNRRCAVFNTPYTYGSAVTMAKCHRWSGAKFNYDETTQHIRSVRTNGDFCWSADYEKCGDFEMIDSTTYCTDTMKIQQCDDNDKKQKWKWDRASGRLEMVHAPNRCLVYDAKRWRGVTTLRTCTGLRPADQAARTTGIDAAELPAFGFLTGGIYDATNVKPGTSNIRQVQTLDSNQVGTEFCGGVQWRKKKRGPVYGQAVIFRSCDKRTVLNNKIYMDKFFYNTDSQKVMDGINYAKYKTCWTWMGPEQNDIMKILKCATAYNSQQTFTHDSVTGRFCLAAYPSKCLTGEFKYGSSLKIVDVDPSTMSQGENQTPEEEGDDAPEEVAPEEPQGIPYVIPSSVSSFGNH